MKFKLSSFVYLVVGIGLIIFCLGLWAYQEETEKGQEIVRAVFNNESKLMTDTKVVALTEKVILPLDQMISRVITPNPLNQLAGGAGADLRDPLTTAGVIAATNEERIRADLPALTESAKLNQVARIRLDDMFKRQYFSHTSPSGTGVAEAAQTIGYGYIVVGENLALGQFKNDAAVVQAWMESEGHKANILARRYFDIGVATGEAEYNGRRSRMAVQIFGTPINVCPAPSELLKKSIYANKEKIDKLEPRLRALKQDLDSTSPSLLGASKKTREYNKLAEEFNTLIRVTQKAIQSYNNSVVLFNNCAKDK